MIDKKNSFDAYVTVRRSNIKALNPDELYLHMFMWTTWVDMDSHKCFPSLSTISNEIGWSESKLRRNLKSLEEKQFLCIVPQERENGSKTSNLYILNDLNDKIVVDERVIYEPVRTVRTSTTIPTEILGYEYGIKYEGCTPSIVETSSPYEFETYPLPNLEGQELELNISNTHITNTQLTTCETSFLEEEKDAVGLTNYFCEKHNQYTESIGSTKKAKATERNVKDMKLFIKFGGLKDGVTTAPPSLETVKAYIDWVYEGGGTDKRGSFCWANVIGSISNLRKHYPQIESMLYRKQAVVSSFAGLADLVDEDGY
jgi:hypothetical protein